MKRDFTYIDDIVEAVVRVQDVIPQANADWTVERFPGHQFRAVSGI